MGSGTVKTWSTPVQKEESRLVPCALCGNPPEPAGFRHFLSCEGFSYVKCTVCGLIQINPQPLALDVEQRYGNLYGNDYLSYELNNEAAFLNLQKLALADAGFDRIELELMEQYSTSNSTPKVLDAGCATGAMLAELRDRGWQAIGVEISPAADYARDKRKLDVRRQSLESCNFPSESFDLALASHLLEHLNRPDMFIQEVWRILRPGASLLLTTPNAAGFQARLFRGKWRSAIYDHLYLFSQRTIKAMLAKHGFMIEGIYTWGGLAAGIAAVPVKTFADKAAKALGLGDVMIIRAIKHGSAVNQAHAL